MSYCSSHGWNHSGGSVSYTEISPVTLRKRCNILSTSGHTSPSADWKTFFLWCMRSLYCLQKPSMILRWKKKKKKCNFLLPVWMELLPSEGDQHASQSCKMTSGRGGLAQQQEARVLNRWSGGVCWHQGPLYPTFPKRQQTPQSLLLRSSLFLLLIQMVSIYTKPVIRNPCIS